MLRCCVVYTQAWAKVASRASSKDALFPGESQKKVVPEDELLAKDFFLPLPNTPAEVNMFDIIWYESATLVALP